MVFGDGAAFLQLNVFARMLTELTNQLLGIPLPCFFHDFGAISPSGLAESAIRDFTLFCSNLGIRLKVAKSEFGQDVAYLGLEGYFPCKSNNYRLSVTLTKVKADRWAEQLRPYIQAGFIHSDERVKLIWTLAFSHTNLCGKFARTQLKPLYAKL